MIPLRTTLRHGTRPARRSGGFTMVEIALCLGVIGFAIVAIIGVLPLGMQVQRDNREDTIINQDGNLFLESIRNGAQGMQYLTQYVERVSIVYENNTRKDYRRRGEERPGDEILISGDQIIGLLTTPRLTNENPEVLRTEATVRAISGAAVEKGIVNVPETAFKYLLIAEVSPTVSYYTNDMPDALRFTLQTNLHDVRLALRYPLIANDKPGPGKQVFRAVVGSPLLRDRDDPDLYFFQPTRYIP